MKNLTNQEIALILNGSSWFGTGGGFPLSKQLSILESGDLTNTRLATCDDLPESSTVLCAYGLGSAANTSIDHTLAFKRAIDIATKLSGEKCTAVFPAEPNIESAVFKLANKINLPVLDADTCGGRAVPELCFDNFTIHNKSVAPIIACNQHLEEMIINSYSDINEAEAKLRHFAELSPGGSIAVVDHIISVYEARKLLTLGSIQRSMQLGIALEDFRTRSITISELLKQFNASIIVDYGVITESSVKNSLGFLQGEVKVFTSNRNLVICIKNELLKVRDQNAQEFCAPDLLIPLDPEKLVGLHSTELSVGRDLMLIKIKCSTLWDGIAGRELFVV